MILARPYLENGFALVRIPIGRKAPNARGWNIRENVILDSDDADAITGNVGIAHAYCQPSPTAALDIDDIPLATNWLKERGLDLEALIAAPDAVQILSGRAQRSKLLYRLELGTVPLATKQISDPASGDMVLEFRCASTNGTTVQDVLPPSIHPETGQPYQWGGAGDWRQLPTIPADLLAIWREEVTATERIRSSRRSSQPMFNAVDDTPRQRAAVIGMLAHISASCSYVQYRNIVWSILSLGWNDGENLARDWCSGAPDRFDEASFEAVIASYDGSLSPSIGSIIHFAREGGWDE